MYSSTQAHSHNIDLAGLAVYRAALTDPAITHVTVLTRRPIPEWVVLPPNASSKTTVIQHNDFMHYSPELTRQLAASDSCIWALGKSSTGMTESEYTELTHGYVVAALQALRDGGAGEHRSEHQPFRFVFISSEQADPSGKSSQMWARVKVCGVLSV